MSYEYPELEDLKVEWHEEHKCPIIPALSDTLLFASVEGKEIKGETAENVFRYLKENMAGNTQQNSSNSKERPTPVSFF